MSDEVKIDWQRGAIALAIAIGIFLINVIFNPPEIPDTSKPAISYLSTGEPVYETKSNPYYICGFILIVFIMISFIMFGSSFFQKRVYIMTFPEAYRHIPVDETLHYELPPETAIDTKLIVPKDGGKSCYASYKYKGGMARIKLNLLSDFKDSSGDYSRRSPLISWTNLPLSPSSGQALMRSDSDTLKQLAQIDKQVEKATGTPLTANLFQKKYQETKKRMEEGGVEGDEE